jgi:branched-chain amino acid transport system substrate-binding protein
VRKTQSRVALLRASVLSVAVIALAAACSSSSSSSTSSTSSTASSGAASASAAGSGGTSSGSDLVIGTIGNFGGAGAASGHLQGLEAWVDWTNDNGGIKGHQIKLIVEDDQGDGTTSQSDIRQLVEVDHVLAIVSPEDSETESGWASYIQQQGVAVIGGEADTPEWFTNPSFFPSSATVLTSVEMQAYAVKAAGKTKFGVMYCAEESACKNAVTALQGYTKPFGITMTTSAAVALTAPSYTPQCLAAQQSGAQVILMQAGYTVGIKMAQECSQQGYNPVWVIPSGAFDNHYLSVSQMNGAYVPTPNALWFASTPAVQQFQQAMAKYESGTTLGANPISGWSGGALFGAAAANLPANPTRADMFTALYALPKNDTLDGLTSPLNFHKGAPASQVTCFFMAQIKNGQMSAPQGTSPICP